MKQELKFTVNPKIYKKGIWVFTPLLIIGITLILNAETLGIDEDEILNIYTIGGLMSLASGFFLVLFLLKIRSSNKRYFKMNKIGFEDRSDSPSYGLIKWSDMKEIKFSTIDNNRSIFIYVNNPAEFIDNHPSFIFRQMMKICESQFETPIVINAEMIYAQLEEFPEKMEEYFEEYKN